MIKFIDVKGQVMSILDLGPKENDQDKTKIEWTKRASILVISKGDRIHFAKYFPQYGFKTKLTQLFDKHETYSNAEVLYTDGHLIGKYEYNEKTNSKFGFLTCFPSWTMNNDLNFKMHDGSGLQQYYSYKQVLLAKSFESILQIITKSLL